MPMSYREFPPGSECASCYAPVFPDRVRGDRVLFAVDDDERAPWVCRSCYVEANDRQPEDAPDSPNDYYDRDMPEGEDDGSDESQEETDDDIGSPVLPALYVADLPDRPSRTVSVEQEVGRGGNWIAAELRARGLTTYGTMLGYHSGSSDRIYVEEDGSVAGEVIYSRFNLSDIADARLMEDALSVVQRGMGEDAVKLDMRCGLHVHVDARRLTMTNLTSLYHLWNYLEDTLYRLASANWRCHRTEIAETNYAPKTRKGASSVREVGRLLHGTRGGLNVGNYLSAVRDYCTCGAGQFGVWNECECRLQKPTIEFRLWNASANVRKIRAYVALSSAIVAYAASHDVAPDVFPPLEWTEDTGTMDVDENGMRLGFILSKLPLTEAEREDVRYCASRCSLASVRPRAIVGAAL
jgi:hypothetical protein